MTIALDLPLVAIVSRPTLRVLPAPPNSPPYDDEPGPRPLLHLVPDAPDLVETALGAFDESHWFSEDRTPSADLPSAEKATVVLLQALVEVLAGARPLVQLRRQLSMELYAELRERLEGRTPRLTARPEQRCVRSVHAQLRPEGIAEICAMVLRRDKLAAIALRLEGQAGAWICTELEGI